MNKRGAKGYWISTAKIINQDLFDKYVKKVVVGVDNSNQLEDIVRLKVNTKKNYNFQRLNCVDEKIINPSKW